MAELIQRVDYRYPVSAKIATVKLTLQTKEKLTDWQLQRIGRYVENIYRIAKEVNNERK